MSLAVQTDSAANQNALERAMAKKNRKAALAQYGAEGIYVIHKAFTIPVTAFDDVGDEYQLLYFPPNTQLLNLHIKVSDGDSSTGLTFDIITDDGTTENKLVNASTAGQAGGSIGLGANAGNTTGSVDPTFLEVGNKYLSWQCAAAASGTATAVTLTLRCTVLIGNKYITTW